MNVYLLFKMWCILVLCPVLLAAGAQTLSIDSQLGTSVEDCFERISIGEQIPANAVYRNVSELTTRECEQICKQDKQCQAYDYGVGAKGNATCDLSKLGEKELKEKNTMNRHPDYDVYVRRFQCEQSPPSPLKPLQDEGAGPAHRPVFRPEVEESKRPLDDFDSRPFETARPERPYPPYNPYKPQYLNHINRPDDYANQKPEYNRPPSYGLHRPQDIPYRPERPYKNNSDPYDVLHFQGERPQYPVNWRPDPYYPPRPSDEITDIYNPNRPRPELPPFRPEEPEYVYITRPYKKPVRPLDEPAALPGYGNQPSKPSDYPSSSGLYGSGPNDGPRPPYKPNRPMDYPYRPFNRPSYDYNSQYASNYGQSQYNDNSVYVEIYDPPRPYKPSKPVNDRPYGPSEPVNDRPYGPSYGQNYGYVSQSSSGGYGSSYSQSQYGSGIHTQLDDYNRPADPYKPQNSPSAGYGQQDITRPEIPYDKPSSGYGVQDERPSSGYGGQDVNTSHIKDKPYQRPISGYGERPSSGYGDRPSGYGDLDSVHRPTKPHDRPSPVYGVSDSNQRPEKPDVRPSSGYGTELQEPVGYIPQKPSYGTGSSGYGSSHSSSHFDQTYGSQLSSYGSSTIQKPQDDYQKPSYSDKPSYNANKPSYSNNQGFYSTQGYGSNQNGYNINQGYGTESYGSSNRPLQSTYQEHDQQSSYGGSSQSYGSYQASYRPINDYRPLYDKPSYNRPEYDAPSYGNKPNDPPSYGNRPYDKPSYNRPYEQPPIDPRPSYDKPLDIYGNRPSYDSKPDYNNRPSYEKPGYGEKPSYDKPGYNEKPLYDRPIKKPTNPSYDQSYDSDRPDGSYGVDSDSGDYKNSGKPKPNETDGYNSNKPDIKPVYEFELDKPNNVPSYIVRPSGEVITSRPVTIGNYGERPERPGYGREPAVSYKGTSWQPTADGNCRRHVATTLLVSYNCIETSSVVVTSRLQSATNLYLYSACYATVKYSCCVVGIYLLLLS